MARAALWVLCCPWQLHAPVVLGSVGISGSTAVLELPLNGAAALNFVRQCRDVLETSAVTVPGDGGKTRWRRGKERLSSPCGTVLHWGRWMPLQAALSLLRRDRFSYPKWVHLLPFQLAKGTPHQPPRGCPQVLPCPSRYLHECSQMPARTSAP